MLPKNTTEYSERFWSRVAESHAHECWPWTGRTSRRGYGQIGIGKKVYGAHRIAYFLHTGVNPEGKLVCHHCDNPSCCNPAHLFLGTHTDNMRDMLAKGRGRAGKHHNHSHGISHPNAKVTDVLVVTIREMAKHGASLKYLAEAHNLHITTIWAIVHRRTWKHLL